MIHVMPQPEPEEFDAKVRQKGLNYLRDNDLSLDQPLPPETRIPAYWRDCLDQLHVSYAGVCAYLAVFVERVTGVGSVDHFIAKSALAGRAYEWGNYRLACAIMNSRKRDYDDVLDPLLTAEWKRFLLRFDEVSGVSFDQKNGVNITKGYMESGEFSRGKESIRADGSIVLEGNFDVDVEHQQRIGHLFGPLPPEMRDDTAFMDRIHAYLPGWYVPKMHMVLFTDLSCARPPTGSRCGPGGPRLSGCAHGSSEPPPLLPLPSPG